MQPQQVDTQKTPLKQSHIEYNLSKLGLLEWSGDGHIRLFALDSAGQPAELIFDCLPSQIKRGRVSLGTLALRLPEKTYLLDFTGAFKVLLRMNLTSGYMGDVKEPPSDLPWWVDNLKNQGVVVKQFNQKKFSIISTIVVFVLMLVAVVILIRI